MTAPAQTLRVALAQMNPVVGDIAGNAAAIGNLMGRAREAGAQLVVFPELALTGYPPEDLLLKRQFLDAARGALDQVAAQARDIVAVVGFPERAADVHNCAAVLSDGEVAAVYRKIHLPNYGVFDEQRYFAPGEQPAVFKLRGVSIGLTVCEDIWEPGPPATAEALAGAELIVNLSASPYHAGKGVERERMLVQRARDNLASVVFCNCVGGQDELVFDGHSLVIDEQGQVLARGPQFEEALLVCDVNASLVAAARLRDPRHRTAREREQARSVLCLAELEGTPGPDDAAQADVAPLLDPTEEVYAALSTGLRDYVDKNRFERVVLALSGGIDSALTALVAVDALGSERVTCVSMPSPYSSEGTKADARAIAQNLGVDFLELAIEDTMRAYERLLAEPFGGRDDGIAAENIQARIRGNVVMALSNKFGWLVLTTGNKSELSVGYATLYGDMAGGFAVLKDVFKTRVFELTRWRNAHEGRELVPSSVIERPPSAELRAEQRDDQSLPPYELLDAILAGYVERDLDAIELVGQGLPAEEVERTIRLVDGAEYKRRQAPPGIRISTKAFGRDRRLPITNRYESRLGAETPRLRALG